MLFGTRERKRESSKVQPVNCELLLKELGVEDEERLKITELLGKMNL